jgi:hypothetical protein
VNNATTSDRLSPTLLSNKNQRGLWSTYMCSRTVSAVWVVRSNPARANGAGFNDKKKLESIRLPDHHCWIHVKLWKCFTLSDSGLVFYARSLATSTTYCISIWLRQTPNYFFTRLCQK